VEDEGRGGLAEATGSSSGTEKEDIAPAIATEAARAWEDRDVVTYTVTVLPLQRPRACVWASVAPPKTAALAPRAEAMERCASGGRRRLSVGRGQVRA